MGAPASMLRLSTLALFAAISVAADAPPSSLPAADQRLDRPTTVARGTVYLGELLEDLSRQTGVRLLVEQEKGPLDGIALCVRVRQRPLREVMASLQEVITYPQHRGEWRPVRTGAGGYQLHHYPSFSEAAERSREAIRRAWVADLQSAHRVAGQTDVARTVESNRYPRVFPMGVVNHSMLDLITGFPLSQMDPLLRGATVPLDRTRLTERGKDALRLGLVDGGANGKAPSVKAGFYVRWDADRVAPILWVRNEYGVAGSALGGPAWDHSWLQKECGDWTNAAGEEVTKYFRAQVKDLAANAERVPDKTLGVWTKRLHENQGLNILIDPVVPLPRTTQGTAFLGRTPQQSIYCLIMGGDLTWKKVGSLEVFRHESVLVHPRTHLIPWKEVRDLRRTAQRNDGYLDLPALAKMARYRAEQLAGLAPEFPDAHPKVVERWRPVYDFYDNLTEAAQKQLLSASGLPYPHAGVVAREALFAPRPGAERVPALDILGRERLITHSNQATVALRLERIRPTLPRREAEGEQERTRLIWTIRVTGMEDHVASLDLAPRTAIEKQ